MHFPFKRRRKVRKKELTLPEKTNRILNGILVTMLLILFRIWHLSLIQHEEKVQEASRPQRRVVITPAERATIQDRFGIALAVNKVQYNAAILYARIREIPRFIWKKDASGKKYKFFKRREYIHDLAKLLGERLHMDAERIEDLIHAKASIFGNVPLVIAENVDEPIYFRLKMLEKDWPGIFAEVSSRRCYPLGACAGEVVGYMGAISQIEYENITSCLKTLRESLSKWEAGEENPLPIGVNTIEEVEEKLERLEKKAYHINDRIGKVGVEGAFEENLRGLRGKKTYLADTRGSFLRELPGGEETQPGTRLKLAISAELQEYGEKLLGEFEGKKASWIREGLIPECQPWIKGGAIVAMDPNNGEVIAMASFPRFDPNDFTLGKKNVHKWLEDLTFISSLWNQTSPLERETFSFSKGIFESQHDFLTWDLFLKLTLSPVSPIRAKLVEMKTINEAAKLQIFTKQLLAIFQNEPSLTFASKVFDFLYQDEENIPQRVTITLQERERFSLIYSENKEKIERLKSLLFPFFRTLPMNFEKILLVDMCQLAVDPGRFSTSLLDLIGQQEIKEYKRASAAFASIVEVVSKLVDVYFNEAMFQKWRQTEFKKYLHEKREQEKKEKRWARPYTDYLEEAYQTSFKAFWNVAKWDCVALFLTGDKHFLQSETHFPLKQLLLTWHQELKRGAHRAAPWIGSYHELTNIVDLFDGSIVIPYLKTLRTFDDLTRPLYGRYFGLRYTDGLQLEKDLAASFYPTYGYGYARSIAFRAATTVGSIFKLVPAYVALTQRYRTLEENHTTYLSLNPLTIVDDKRRHSSLHGGWSVGKTLDGRHIPMFYKGGRLPRSDHSGIGKVDLIKAIEASSNPYFSLLAGDVIRDPEDLIHAAKDFSFGTKTGIDLPGEYRGNVPSDVVYNRTGLYALAIGQHSLVGTPLQVAVMLSAIGNGGFILKPKIVLEGTKKQEVYEIPAEIKQKLYLPQPVRLQLLKGMQQVVLGEKGTARLVRTLSSLKGEGGDLTKCVVGKTSTAEALERFGIDGRIKAKHVWFGAISFDPDTPLLPGEEKLYQDSFGKPDLVVVVYLRLGSYGNVAAPLAFKMIKKWREIKKRSFWHPICN